ncbi:hypothetical protein Y032_0048g1565 [Ancylostoma ceylanicum]|uniref:Phosphatidylinositol 4-kinase type 2 n=1 Tax=Ancylostoma ceylanicum TaxID=53326 RepID=A0A016U9N3_9BILA|nr:hypothetical protein Y032_0048g1565 [Ancylostoma ceylanicum]
MEDKGSSNMLTDASIRLTIHLNKDPTEERLLFTLPEVGVGEATVEQTNVEQKAYNDIGVPKPSPGNSPNHITVKSIQQNSPQKSFVHTNTQQENSFMSVSTEDMKSCDYVVSERRKEHEDEEFKEVFHKAQEALRQGIHPVLIPVGSSGSYFIRDENLENIAVFKPSDEEPFAALNPKWPKFFQRILCFCCFGRACLIPNNGYLSETGASIVDDMLQLHIVPKTRVVRLASPSFFYSRCCGRYEIKPKEGSFQVEVAKIWSRKVDRSKLCWLPVTAAMSANESWRARSIRSTALHVNPGECALIPNEDSANGGSDESEFFIFFHGGMLEKYGGECGIVVRGLLRTHTTDGSIALQANQALLHLGVDKFLPEESGRM